MSLSTHKTWEMVSHTSVEAEDVPKGNGAKQTVVLRKMSDELNRNILI